MAQTATPQYCSHLHLGFWMQRSVLKAPGRTTTFSTGPLCTVPVHTKHTPSSNSSLLSHLLECHTRRNSDLTGLSTPSLPFRARLGKDSAPFRACWIQFVLQALPRCAITTEMFHRAVTRPRAVPQHVSERQPCNHCCAIQH